MITPQAPPNPLLYLLKWDRHLAEAVVLSPEPGTKKSPARFYHAATKAVRKAFWQAYAAFLSAFREAGDRWREGDRRARFPVGSFPPGLPS
jgi:hypothetical protein